MLSGYLFEQDMHNTIILPNFRQLHLIFQPSVVCPTLSRFGLIAGCWKFSVWIKIAEGLQCLSTGRHSRSNLPDVPHMALETLEKFPHRPYVDFSKNNQKRLAQEL